MTENNDKFSNDAYNAAYGSSQTGAAHPQDVSNSSGASHTNSVGDPFTNTATKTTTTTVPAFAHTTGENTHVIKMETSTSTPSSSFNSTNNAGKKPFNMPSSTTSFGSANGGNGGDLPPVGGISGGAASVKPKGSSNAKTFVIAFAGALIACILAFAVVKFFGIKTTTTTLGSSSSSTITASDTGSTLAEQVANKALPSVVSVNVYGTQSTSSGNSILDYLYGNGGSNNSSGTLTQTSAGSGVIISKDGYIITNQHVIADGQKYEVVINGETKEAKLVGQDASSDIAVLKVDADNLTPIELGDSDDITTGEWVMTIGNPFGLEQSVATGIISATSRSQIVDSSNSSSSKSGETAIYPNMIQTDAAINPGNSGGALVDENGKLIGINTLITSYSGNYSGVGFAIPVNYAVGIARSLIEGKAPTYAALGVSLSTINETYAKRFGFAVDEGAYVSDVVAASGADIAGIKQGDIITEFDGEKVESASDLTLDVRKKNPGDKVKIKFYRGNEQKEVEVTLGQSEAKTSNNSSNSDSNSKQYGYNNNNGNGSSSLF